MMRITVTGSLLIFATACGHAASPADNIALGPSKTCSDGAVWDGIECATPHVQKSPGEEEPSPADTVGAKSASKETDCDGDDCDDALDRPPSTDSDFMAQGIAAYNARDYPKARKLFYELISKHPNSPHVGDAYFWFGRMFEDDAKSDPSKLPLAVQSFLEAGKFPKATQGPAALLELGNVYLRLGETAKASASFGQLRKRFPGSAAASKIPPGH